MKLKRALKIAVAMLLVVCMLLPVLASCKKKTPETPGTTPTPQPNPKPEENLTACQHTVTTLKNDRVATCDEEGYTGDKICASCGAVVVTGTVIAKTAHTYDGGQTTKNPTCMETGVKTFTCTGCGTTKSEPIDKAPHSDIYHDALDGGHTHTCEHCTMNEYAVHTPKDSGTSYPASCLEPAYTEYTCVDCEGVYKVYSTAEADKAIGHDWGEWTVTEEATCSDLGSKTHFCQNGCGESETIDIPVIPTAHSYFETHRDEPSCSAEGTAYYTCEHCDAPTTKTLAKLPHVLGDAAPAGDGWTHQYCVNDCGYKVSTFDASTQDNATVSTDSINAESNFGVSMETATMEFPKDLVSSMTETAGADVAINAGVVENKDELLSKVDEAQKARLEDVDIYDFSVSVGGAPLNFNGNTVTVTLHYELKDGEDPEGILIWYVADDGTIQNYTAVYDAETETVTFEAEHFSYYAVAYEETQAMRCRRGVHVPEVKDIVEPSCYMHGYTVYECTHCHHIDISDIKDKLNHNYSSKIQPEITCDEGGYVTQVCLNEDCHHTIYYEYIRAKGHTITEAATCTKGAVCTTCNKVAVAARGHNYTEWVVVVEPTDIKTGLRRHYCLRCGEKEEVKLAATGNVTKLEFDSVEEVFEALMAGTFGMENGTLSFVFEEGTPDTAGYQKIQLDITLNKETSGYVALIDVTDAYINKSGEDRIWTMQALYRNGLVFMIEDSSTRTEPLRDIMGYLNMPIDTYLKSLKLSFEYMNPYMETYFDELDNALKELNDKVGEELDRELEAAGSDFCMADMLDTMKSVKTLYAYVALKLGAATNIMMEDGVEVPTLDDLLIIADAFMTKTEATGRTDYALESAPFMEALDTIVTWLEEKAEASLAELIWDMIGADVTAAYPDITDWAGLVAKLKQTYTDETKVSDLVDDLITLIEEKEIGTIEELYAAIDALVIQAMGQEIDSAAIVKQYADLTLGELACGMIEGVGSMEELFDGFDGMLSSMLFGELALPRFGSVNALVQMARGLLDSYDPSFDFSFAIDDAGNLLDMSFDADVKTKLPADASPDDKAEQLIKISADIKNDSTVKVQIPDNLKPVQDVKVEASFDAAGNLIVKVPTGCEPNFDLEGGTGYLLKDYLVRDAEVSSAFGYDIYRLPQNLWTEEKEVGTYYLYNGKYYTATYDYMGGVSEITSLTSLSSVMADPTLLLPAADETPYAYYETNSGFEPIYRIFQYEYVAKVNGEWCLLQNCQYDHHESGPDYSYSVYTFERAVSFTDAMAGLELSQWSASSAFNFNNKQVESYYAYFYLDTETWGSSTVTDYLVLIDNQLYFFETTYTSGYDYYVLEQEVATLPQHDEQNVYNTSYDRFYTQNGTEITGVKRVELITYLPTYYMAVNTDTFISLNAYYLTAISTGDRETLNLPDGNVLYVKETIPELDEGGKYDTIVTGYVKLPNGQYINTLVYYLENEIVDVLYREASTENYAYYRNLVDLDSYMTKVDATTYKFSAALFTALNELCRDTGTLYGLALESELKVGNDTFDLEVMLMQHIDMPDQMPEIGNITISRISWSEYFPSLGLPSEFTVTVNDDGTLTIAHNGGKELTVNYNTGYYFNEYPADDYLVKDPDMSTETGMDIYSAVTSYSGSDYLYKNGKYYTYNRCSQYTFDTVSTPEAVIKQHWRLGSLYSRYLTDLDPTDAEDIYPVYQGSVYFGDFYHNSSVAMFFIIKDNTLMVLTGTQNLGESILKFEDYVPVSEYFSSLTLTRGDSDTYDSAYINGSKVTIYSMSISWDDKNASGETVRSYYVDVHYYDNNKYIVDYDYKGDYLEIGEELTSTPAHTKTETRSYEYVNGTFTFVTFLSPRLRHYVKLADGYYDWNYNWNSYCDQRRGENSMLEALADKEWYYCKRSWDSSSVSYYLEYDPATQTFSGLIAELPEYLNTQECRVDTIYEENTTYYVYEVSGYLPGNLVYETQTDGTVFVHRDGENDGYLKGQDGYYVPATKVEAEDGSTYIVCTTIGKAYFTSDMLEYNGVFDDCMILSADKTKLTITPALLDKIPENMQDYFYLRLEVTLDDGWETTGRYSYVQLATLMGRYDADDENGNGDDGLNDKFVSREELEIRFN
ncbi:MAG: hypothetical protein IJW51_01435 [Clostridia bacterium]|nr:hypothetical protein [Clostridia bacterium]